MESADSGGKKQSKKTVYDDAKERITSVAGEMGTLQFKMPKLQAIPADDGKGNVYGGQKNPKGEEEGYGVKSFNNGTLYAGEWKAGKASGKGWFFHADGDVYKGDWADDKAHGRGMYRHANGASYEGQWVEDKQ